MPTWIPLALAIAALVLALAAPVYPRFSSLGGRIPLGRWALLGGWLIAFLLIVALLARDDPRPMSAEGVSQADSVREAREAARAAEEAQLAAADSAGTVADSAAVHDDRLMAYRMAEGVVRRDPRTPAAARFPGAEEGRVGHVTRLSERRYEIRSYVDGADGAGSPTRTRWSAEVVRGEGEAWEVRDVVIEGVPTTP